MREVGQQRDILSYYANIPKDDIVVIINTYDALTTYNPLTNICKGLPISLSANERRSHLRGVESLERDLWLFPAHQLQEPAHLAVHARLWRHSRYSIISIYTVNWNICFVVDMQCWVLVVANGRRSTAGLSSSQVIAIYRVKNYIKQSWACDNFQIHDNDNATM